MKYLDIQILHFFVMDNFKKGYNIDDCKREVAINHPFILNEENWHQYKTAFKQQRINEYKKRKGLSEKEKETLEIKKINALLLELKNTNLNYKDKENFEILADRYKSSLTSSTQSNTKQKPELNEALISFNHSDTIENLHKELKGYFKNKEAELQKALQGKNLTELLLFPHNQNKFVEVFKRLKYNGCLLNTPKEIENWICSNFSYQYQKGNKKEVRNFNTSTVHDILTKDKGEPTKKERICTTDWLPYKSHLTRQREAEKENN